MTESVEQTSKELQQVRLADQLTRKHGLTETQNKILQSTPYDSQDEYALEFADSNTARKNKQSHDSAQSKGSEQVSQIARERNEKERKLRENDIWKTGGGY